MTDLTTLRRLAEAATPGPWQADGPYVSYGILSVAGAQIDIAMPDRQAIANAAYTAAMNPATTLALLDELAELRSAIITFCAPWAVTYSKMMGLPPGHIYAAHYDLLEKCGARMVDFVRYEP